MTTIEGSALPADLAALASELGVREGYRDVVGEWQVASSEAVVAVARAAGALITSKSDAAEALAQLVLERLRRGLEPVVVAWDAAGVGTGIWLPLGTAGRASVELIAEDGHDRRWELDLAEEPDLDRAEADGLVWVRKALGLPPGLEVGAHALTVDMGDERWSATVLAAPTLLPAPEPWERLWGLLCPLWAVRSKEGGATLRELDRIGGWIADHGGGVVATLPLLSSFASDPGLDGQAPDPSPYAPVSRRFWNELYLDLDALPGGSAEAAAPRVDQVLRRDAGGHFDVAARAAEVREAVTRMVDHLGDSFERETGYQRFLAANPDVEDYAAFRAVAARRGAGWHDWPQPARDGVLFAGDFDEREARYHRYSQWAFHEQLSAVRSSLRGRGQRLYLDLPIGSHAEGYDTWSHRHLFAPGVETGAPPDDFFKGGQTWGFPPIVPRSSREDAHRFVAACLRTHVEVAGVLRIDHVMQFERLFWVPAGFPASEGVYVDSPGEELFATLSIEAHRSQTVVVGEDLGTVTPQTRSAMGRHRLGGMYVVEFEARSDGVARAPLPGSTASITTHDTPTFARWLGEPGDRRAAIARWLEAMDAPVGRSDDRSGDQRSSGAEPDVAVEVLCALGRSDATLVLAMMEDLTAASEAVNIPGTGADRPNWVQRWAAQLEEIESDEGLSRALEALQRARLSSYERAVRP